MRYLYSFLLYLATPFILLRLLRRSRRLADYRKRIAERFGFYSFKLEKCIWVHAVSVGETLAAIPIINELKKQYPQLPLLVTTMTPTGSARVKAAFGNQVQHVYLPYDLPDAVARFLKAMNPVISVIIETELWPNLLAACHRKHIPVCLVNARLSEKSAQGYRKVKSLAHEMLQHLTFIAAQGEADAQRFVTLGAAKEKVKITGNIKFDLDIPTDLEEKKIKLRESLGKDRFIWIAASTHQGEEEVALTVHKQILDVDPTALLIVVPRHPDRFSAIAKLCEKDFKTVRRSESDHANDATVYLGDTMGDLMLLYAVSDAVFVGGSLMARGGHNILEPAALGKATLTGPNMHNFAEITELFSSQHALLKINDATSLANHLIHLIQNIHERIALGQRAQQVLNANRGALPKQLEMIFSLIGN